MVAEHGPDCSVLLKQITELQDERSRLRERVADLEKKNSALQGWMGAVNEEQAAAFEALCETPEKLTALESENATLREQLDDERHKVGLMMQPMPGETLPSESSLVWRMLQQWIANRDLEKRQQRELVTHLESDNSALRERVEALTVLSEARGQMLDALQDMVRLEAPHIAERIAAAREAERDGEGEQNDETPTAR